MKASCGFSRREEKVATQSEIFEENRKVRRLQIVVDLVMNVLSQSEISVEEASELVGATREFALSLFPDKEQTYDLIYKPRFQRLMAEKYRMV
ncbi:MAG: hypothetical protein ABSB82_23525 [Terriglobia bacterium]